MNHSVPTPATLALKTLPTPEGPVKQKVSSSLLLSSLPYYSVIIYVLCATYMALELKMPFLVLFMSYGFVPLMDELLTLD